MSLSKPDLRARMRVLRRQLGALNPSAAEHAAQALPLDDIPSVAVVAGYHAIGGELSSWPVLRRLAARGARIALPVSVDRASPLIFRAWTPGEPLTPDAVGAPAPLAQAERLTPDLVIAPVLAFDDEGYRLGQGGGHYDRTLEVLRGGFVFVIGLAFAGQRVARVPREPHDQPLDAILTETGYYPVRKDTV